MDKVKTNFMPTVLFFCQLMSMPINLRKKFIHKKKSVVIMHGETQYVNKAENYQEHYN